MNINDEISDWRELIGLPQAAPSGANGSGEPEFKNTGKFMAKSPFFAAMRAKSDRLLGGFSNERGNLWTGCTRFTG